MRRQRVLLGMGVLLLAIGAMVGLNFAAAGNAVVGDVQHGIGVTKGCTSPTNIGQPYQCTYQIINTIDEAQDTITFDGVNDTVHASGGNISSHLFCGAWG